MNRKSMGILDKSFFIFAMIILITACLPTEEDEISTTDESDPNEMDDPTDGEVDSEVITWENWYLSIPVDRGNGNATSIFYQDIINDNLTAEESKYFYKNDDGSYTMWTKFTGFTTSGLSQLGEKYCRTELREFWRGKQDGTDNWSMSTGVHILESTLQVDFVEGNGLTIIAQIHGKESPGISGNPATVKIRWNNGMIQIDHYTQPDAGDPWTSKYDKKVNFERVDNEVFTIKIKIEDGKLFCALVCEEKNLNIPYTEFYDYSGNGYIHDNYFKTGNYFAWNDDYEKAAQVVLHKVLTEHR